MTTRLAFLLVNQMLATSATLPMEMLQAARGAALGRRKAYASLSLSTVGTSHSAVQTGAGMLLTPQFTLNDAPSPDIIFVPALWRNPQRALRDHQAIVPWLKMMHEKGATIAGVGTGCCFIAASGLLDGKPGTTHWHYFDTFEKLYPQVKLKRDYFITQADDIYCSASINALADLTVHFIQRLFDNHIARHVERHFSHEIRRAYESMRYYEGSTEKHSDEDILQVQLWLQDHYQETLSFADVANQFGMSTRSFNRRFKLAVGKTPVKYLQDVRLATAKELLQTSNFSVGEIAFRVGYQDVGYFSTLFKQTYNTTPHDYRTTVRAKLFSIGP